MDNLAKKQIPVCDSCESSQVFVDAWAEWDVVNQEWILQNTFDNAYCEVCTGETSLNWINTKEQLNAD